jgi:acetolactate synthase-1/2/3 large subunit
MTTPNTDVVGWGRAGAAWAEPAAWSCGRALSEALVALGVRQAFGLLGGGIAPFAAGLAATAIEFFHLRHEAGAGFAAIEASLISGRPTLAVVTTGPGLINILNPLFAARLDGARLLLISGATPAHQRGRGAVQETGPHNLPSELYRPGCLFDDAALVESPEELAAFVQRLARGWARPEGWVAHLALPMGLQTRILPGPLPLPPRSELRRAAPSAETLDACLDALRDPDALLWLGSGAQGAAAVIRRFVEAARLPVLCSPRGKGIFPEAHPLFVGVTGAGGSPAARLHLARRRPRHSLVVGSRLGEVTTFLSPELLPSEGLLHVDRDPRAFGAAFPGVACLGIVSDAQTFFSALEARALETGWFARRAPPPLLPAAPPPTLHPRPDEGVRPAFLMAALQSQVVEGSEALLLAEAGTSFTWCNALLRFATPGRYRTSPAWGSMGHVTTGALGAALAGRRKVVAVVGDGAMLMNNEINAAVQYRALVVWVVLNDAQLGLNEHGMTALGMAPVETQMPRTDFVAFARSQGAAGRAVHSEGALEDALVEAMAAAGPFVVDVQIDPTVPSPVVADRVSSLRRQSQGAGG